MSPMDYWISLNVNVIILILNVSGIFVSAEFEIHLTLFVHNENIFCDTFDHFKELYKISAAETF